MDGLNHSETAEGVAFEVRVAPRSSRNEILGVHDGALKVALTAPPVDGAANAALTKLLAKRLGVSRRSVRIVRGESSRVKRILVEGVGAADLQSLRGEGRAQSGGS